MWQESIRRGHTLSQKTYRISSRKAQQSQPLPIYLPYIQHPRPLPRREARVTCISGIVHVVVNWIWSAVALWPVRIEASSGAVVACGHAAVGTGVFVCWAASYAKKIISMVLGEK